MTHSLDPKAMIELRKVMESINELNKTAAKLTEALNHFAEVTERVHKRPTIRMNDALPNHILKMEDDKCGTE